MITTHDCQIKPLDVFFKAGVFKYFAKITEKQLCWTAFFDKVLAGSFI